MANQSNHKFALFPIVLFAIFAIFILYIDLDPQKEFLELEVSKNELDRELTDKPNDFPSNDPQSQPSPVIESIIMLNHNTNQIVLLSTGNN